MRTLGTLDGGRVALIARGGAVAIGAACIAHGTALAGHPRSASMFAGAASVALVASVLTLRPWTIGTAMALIALTYCYAVLRADEGLDPGAPLMGLGLLLLGEFLEFARAAGERRLTEIEVWRRRMVFLLAVSAGGAATGQLALLVAGAARGTGPVLLFLAAAAALTGLVMVLRMVQSLMRDGASADCGR
jgi:hypothetical protein